MLPHNLGTFKFWGDLEATKLAANLHNLGTFKFWVDLKATKLAANLVKHTQTGGMNTPLCSSSGLVPSRPYGLI
jgi:hypothetical protein